ncbi:CAAX prenyl protease-like protein [Stackebrandtia endophytica]|uniref:CAAX prenyl protease-like protein n=2 Tax=Stackebrandtia endophytica TaxID=1496996 RepID=A0A543B2B8_9ACTN|nr:CAAX prenyl protease-like protein [Stackebrandtia endophytica]
MTGLMDPRAASGHTPWMRPDAPEAAAPTRRRRTWLVLTVWFVTSAVSAMALLALQPVIGLSMEILSLVMLAPGIGAAITWLTVRKDLPTAIPAVSGGRFTVAMGLSIGTVVVYFGSIYVFRGVLPEVPAEVAGMSVLVMILAQAVGALTEEIGFRGVLFDAIGVRVPRAVTAILVGLLFGFWHVQYFALPVGQHAMFIIGTVALTITMAYVMVGSFWQRMAVCTVIHLGANLALAFTGGESTSMVVFGMAVAIGCLMVTPVAVLIGRRDRRS